MAQVLQLSDGTTTVDLLSGNLKLTSDGWKTETSREKVWETIELISEATDANIRTEKDKIDDLAEVARQYHLNSRNADEVWFTWQSEGESAKQALVYDIESEIVANDPMSSPLLGSDVIILRLAIQRHQDYETTSASTVATASISTTGGIMTIEGVDGWTAKGTAPARISRLNLSTTDATVLSEIWAGIRPLYEGVGSFDPLWEAEDGSAGSGVTAPADGTASGGNKLQCDLTQTANDGLKSYITIGNVVGSNYDHFVGKYHVLARMKVASAATQVLIELAQYWQGSHSSSGITFLDGITAWTLFSLGTVSFPPTGDRGNVASSHADFDDCGFSILANSVDDTGTLDIDCYILIPAEHTLSVLGSQVDNPNSWDLTVYTDPDDQVWGLGVSTQALGGLQISPHNWRYPAQGGLMVIAAQTSSSHALSLTMDIALDIVPRWKTFRAS